MPDRPPLTLDASSAVPPFEQLRTQIARQVSSGRLPAGTRLPTVRQLAAELDLAAGTVARTYRELESDGVVATYGRRGTFVRSEVLDAAQDTAQDMGAPKRSPRGGSGAEIDRAAEDFAAVARTRGLTLAEAQALVERAWRR